MSRRRGAGCRVAVDVSSGVERSQGIKDRAKIEAFVKQQRAG